MGIKKLCIPLKQSKQKLQIKVGEQEETVNVYWWALFAAYGSSAWGMTLYSS